MTRAHVNGRGAGRGWCSEVSSEGRAFLFVEKVSARCVFGGFNLCASRLCGLRLDVATSRLRTLGASKIRGFGRHRPTLGRM